MPGGRLTWIGHATVVIEVGGARLITDPLLRARVAHLVREVPEPGDLGRFDAILISHPHHDHLDTPSLRRLDPAAPVLAPPTAAAALKRSGRTVHALAPGEEHEVAGVRVRAFHAEHDNRRMPWDSRDGALGFVVAGVYFAGDTERFAGMSRLAGTLDAALLPVSGWGPKTGPGHMDAREAAEALALLQPALAVPIHFGTYRRLGHRPEGDPAREFAEHAAELAPQVRIAVVEPGESVQITPAV